MRGLDEGPFSKFYDGSFLTPQRFKTFIKSVLIAQDHGSYSAHSVKIGAALTAAALGYPKYVIQKLGQWKSDAYRRYIQLDTAAPMKLSKALASSVL